MIILNLKGGLGNQLFQLMAVTKFAIIKKHKCIYIYTGNLGDFDVKRAFSLEPFIEELGIEVRLLNKKRWFFNKYILGLLSRGKVIGVNERSYSKVNFLSRILNLYLLDDYFQSIEFFDFNILDRMKSGLVNNYSLLKIFNSKKKGIDITEFGSDNIGVHIRGTDRLKEISYDYIPDYVDSLLSYSKDSVYCFTDDVSYSQKCLNEMRKKIHYLDIYELTDIEEFYLISLFENFVVTNSNSSFSIFARLLANKEFKTVVIKEYRNSIENSLYEILDKCQNVHEMHKVLERC